MKTETAGGRAVKRTPGRPRKLPLAVREQLVLDAAVAAFAERGTAGASVDVIAAAAGINKALVYEHFSSKDELFAAAVVRERDRLVDFIAARYGRSVGLPVRERVRVRFHAFLDFSAAFPTALQLLALPEAAMVLTAAGRGSAHADLTQHLTGEFDAAGLPTGELPAIVAAMALGMTNEVIIRRSTGNWDPEAVVDLLTDFTLAGLAGVDRAVLERAATPRTEDSGG